MHQNTEYRQYIAPCKYVLKRLRALYLWRGSEHWLKSQMFIDIDGYSMAYCYSESTGLRGVSVSV